MLKNWGKRDWIWLVSVLFVLIIVSTSMWLVGLEDINVISYFSFMATGISVVLALLAIGISITQNEGSKSLNSEMHSLMSIMNEKLNGVKDSLININQMKPINNESEVNVLNIESSDLSLTRLHGVIGTKSEWDADKFLDVLEDTMNDYNIKNNVVDYSLMPLRTEIFDYDYITNFYLLVDGEINEKQLRNIVENTFTRIGVRERFMTTHANSIK